MAAITIATPQDTYLDYDLYLAQQEWTPEDWAAHEECELQDEIEREIAQAQIAAMSEEDQQMYAADAAFYEGLHEDNCKETFAMNEQVPDGYAVTWYVAHCWPRYVLWQGENPIAGFKSENAKYIVEFAQASEDRRKEIFADMQAAAHKPAAAWVDDYVPLNGQGGAM